MIAKLTVLILAFVAVHSVQYQPSWDSLDKRPLPSWYDEEKVGLLLHWGVYSVPSYSYGHGSEQFWYFWKGHMQKDYVEFVRRYYRRDFTYADFAPHFTAEFYEPKKWVDIFDKSGVKYVLMTAKYRDGYALFPSNYSYSWNSMDVGPHRDLLGDLYHAVRAKEGLHFGFYYSWYEWFNPLYLKDKSVEYKTHEYVTSRVYPELQQLVTQYKPEVILYDSLYEEAPETYWKSKEFLSWLYNDSPVKETVVVNDCFGVGTKHTHGGYYSYWNVTEFPKSMVSHKWEYVYPLDKYSYGHRRDAYHYDYYTIEHLIQSLVRTVSLGGNFLINVGPTYYGQIPLIAQERLYQMGQWLAINGEGIYKTLPWNKQSDTISKGVWYTQHSTYVYAYIFDYPMDYQIRLGSIDPKIVDKIEMLGYNGQITFSPNSDGGIIVKLPQFMPSSKLQWVYGLKITVVERH